MYIAPNTPTAFFDVDDTLVMWRTPEFNEETTKIAGNNYIINWNNVNYLRKLHNRRHYIIVWSKAGTQWCKDVVEGLDLQNHVDCIISKPTYYIDDIENTNSFMGKHVYKDINLDPKEI